MEVGVSDPKPTEERLEAARVAITEEVHKREGALYSLQVGHLLKKFFAIREAAAFRRGAESIIAYIRNIPDADDLIRARKLLDTSEMREVIERLNAAAIWFWLLRSP